MPLTWLTRSRLAAVVASGLLVVLLAGCGSFGPPQAVTAQGKDIESLYYLVLAIALVIWALVTGLIVFAVIRYRRRPTDTELPPQIHGNNVLEVIWTVVPTIIVAVLFIFSFNTLNTVDAVAGTTDVRIRAVAARFQWSFEYLSPDGQKVLFQQLSPEMTIPAGKTVHLSLRSKDVNHAFYVPQFLFKRDVIPGRENTFEFTVDAKDAGQTFRGQCAELCGTFHDSMLFTVKALAPADYDTWLAGEIAKASQSPSPAQSGGASGAPSGGASGAPSGGAGQTTLELTAKDVKFDKATLEAPADQPFTIKFQNNDQGVSHDVIIQAGSQTLYQGEIFNGVDSRTYPIPALKAGTYTFSCIVHPAMTGTLTVR